MSSGNVSCSTSAESKLEPHGTISTQPLSFQIANYGNLSNSSGERKILENVNESQYSLCNKNHFGSISEISISSEFSVDLENGLPLWNKIVRPCQSTPRNDAIMNELSDGHDYMKQLSIVTSENSIANSDSVVSEGTIDSTDTKNSRGSSNSAAFEENVAEGSTNLQHESKDISEKHHFKTEQFENEMNSVAQANVAKGEDIDSGTLVNKIISTDLIADAKNILPSKTQASDTSDSSDSTTERTYTSPTGSEYNLPGTNSTEFSAHLKADISKSAWGKWLLEKEKNRRKNLVLKLELEGKKIENGKKLAESKLLEKQKAEEMFQKWLSSKNEEIAKKRRSERLSIMKKERDDQIAKERSRALINLHLKQWKEKKHNERLIKEKADLEAKTKALKENEESRQRSEKAYKQWLQEHCGPRRRLYSYGYSSGVIVCYYDATSPPPPTFCNSRPWVSST